MKFLILFCFLISSAAFAEKSATDNVCCQYKVQDTTVFEKIPAIRCDNWVSDSKCSQSLAPRDCCEVSKNGVMLYAAGVCAKNNIPVVDRFTCWLSNPKNMEQAKKFNKPKLSYGQTESLCGNCQLRPVMSDNQWHRWNGYDVYSKTGKYLTHIVKQEACSTNEKILNTCDMVLPEVVVIGKRKKKEEVVPTEDAPCTWASQKIVHDFSKKCLTESQSICIGKMVCKNGTEIHNVACKTDPNSKVCPAKPEDCDKDADFDFDEKDKLDKQDDAANASKI